MVPTPAATSTFPLRTRMPPTRITRAVATETRISTAGITAAVTRPASTLALRLSEFTRSKRRLFSSSRERLWITRTPETFSCRLALTIAIAWRTRMNALRARDCHSAITATNTGMTVNVMSASCTSRYIRKTITSPRLTKSCRTVNSPVVSSSCRTVTSFWTRDMTRPTSFRSRKLSDSFWMWPNI